MANAPPVRRSVAEQRMKYLPLIAVSMLTGILWRLELNMRWGWASLDWIGAFHWAFPIGAAAYLIWMATKLRTASPRSRQRMLRLSIVLGLAAYFGGSITMMWANYRWLGLGPKWQVILFLSSPAIFYAILGAVYFSIAYRLLSPSRSSFWGGVLGYAAAFPLALLLLWATHHKGGPDTIHAVKSGFVFPIIAFSLGMPLMKRNGQQSPPPYSSPAAGSESGEA